MLGILLINIAGFGLFNAYSDPTNSGGATGWDLKVWWINNIFFEGTMRGLFSMLFGAGIVLFTNRSTDGVQSLSVTDAYFRRVLWLLLFGVIHAYLLLWYGEILFDYAIIGMIVYSFKNLNPKKLIICAVFSSLILTTLNIKDYVQTQKAYNSYASSIELKKNGGALSTYNEEAIKEWESIVAEKKPTSEAFNQEKQALSQGYFSIVWYRSTLVQWMHTVFLYRNFWDVFSMMLLGIAFLKMGIFRAEKSNRKHLLMMFFGYSIGITTKYWGTSYLMSNNFSVLSFDLTHTTYELGRIPTTIGHIGLIMLFIKSGVFPFLQRALASVGQMAFTNYILQTIICLFIFMGFGFNMFGKLQRHELYYIVLGIWIVQLIVSPIWLTYFRFGPLEWVWRSLTYWEKKPFTRRRNASR